MLDLCPEYLALSTVGFCVIKKQLCMQKRQILNQLPLKLLSFSCFDWLIFKCFPLPGLADYQIQRLHRGDPLPRLRETGGQALDSADTKRQSFHQERAQRLQVQWNGRPWRKQTLNKVRQHSQMIQETEQSSLYFSKAVFKAVKLNNEMLYLKKFE